MKLFVYAMIIFHAIKWSYGNHPEMKGVTTGEERFGRTRVTGEWNNLPYIARVLGQ